MTGAVSERPKQGVIPGEATEEAQLRREILAAALEELRIWSFERFSVEMVADRAAVDPDVVEQLWNTPEQLIVDALIAHGRQVVVVPDTGSLRGDLAGHLASWRCD